MAANPNPARITDESWGLMESMLGLHPTVRNGGIYANKPGFHNTRNANSSGNYSVQGVRNQRGPGDKAGAYDFVYADAQGGNYSTISVHSQRLYEAGQRSDPRMKGWHEFFGNIDWDSQVEGWNYAKGGPSSSDSSHLWHIHGSECREMVNCWVNKEAWMGTIRGESLDAWTARLGFPSRFCGVDLRRDTWGASVYLVQRELGIVTDGEFGSDTESAVRTFQKAHGLSVDGVVGPVSWSTMAAHSNNITSGQNRTDMYVVKFTDASGDHFVWTNGTTYQNIFDGGRLDKCKALSGGAEVVATSKEEFDFFAGVPQGSYSGSGGQTPSGGLTPADVEAIADAVADEQAERMGYDPKPL